MKMASLFFAAMVITVASCNNAPVEKKHPSEKSYPYTDTITLRTNIKSPDGGRNLPDSIKLKYYVLHINKDSSVFLGSTPMPNEKGWTVVATDFQLPSGK